jgi:hypothetical protein
MDVATPMTFVRYSGNWRGSYEGWLLNSKTMLIQFPPEITGIIQFLYGRSLDLLRGRIAIRADHGKESHQNDMQKGKTFI